MRVKSFIVYENILSQLINGNLSDYKEQINNLSKSELIEFIMFSNDYGYDLDRLKLYHYIKEDITYTEALINEL